MLRYIFIIIVLILLCLISCNDLDRIDFLEVETLEATNPTLTTVQLNGKINGLVERDAQSFGFVWSANETMLDESNNDGLYEKIEKKKSGSFPLKLENLSPNQTYYFRAFAKLAGQKDLTFGEVKDFLTTTIDFGTAAVLYDGGKSATIRGTISGLDANIPIIQHGHVWSLTNEIPTIEQDSVINLGELPQNGDFSSTLSNLKQKETYFIRAYYYTDNGKTLNYEKDVFEYTTNLYDFWENKSAEPGSIGPGSIIDGLAFIIENKAYVGLDNRKLWEFTPGSSNNWKKNESVYPGGYSTPAIYFAVGTKGYAGLGLGEGLRDDIYEFDGVQWKKEAVLQLPRASESNFKLPVFVFDQQVYLLTTVNHEVFHMQHYNFKENRWEMESDSIKKAWLAGRPFFIFDNKGYILGTGDNSMEVSVFDPFAKPGQQWNTDNSLFIEEGVHLGIGFSIENDTVRNIYNMSGSNRLEHSKKLFENSLEDEKTWTRKRDLPAAARSRGIGFSLDGKGYTGFGQASSGKILSDLWEYTPENN